MANVQGVDIGSWRVRVATMDGSFRRWVLRDVVEMEGSVGVVGALEAIRAAEPGWDRAERVAAMPLQRASVRVVRLPFTDRTTIHKALPAEIESSVPYDLAEMVVATRAVDQQKGSSRTRAVIARRADVKELLELLTGLNAEPKLLVLDAEALSAYADRGVQAVIDFGHSRTIIALCQGGQLIAARLVPLGGEALTETIAAHMQAGAPAAEVAKHAARVPEALQIAEWAEPEPTDGGADALDRKTMAALVAALDEQLVEVRAQLIALEDEFGFGVDEVLLAGAGSQLGGLAGRLSNFTGVPVRAVLVPGGHPPSCALAVALARIAATEVPATDLRIGELAFRGHADVLWNVVSWGGMATAAALLVGGLVVGLRTAEAWDTLSELDGKIVSTVQAHVPGIEASRLADSSMALAIFQGEADTLKAKVDALGSTIGGDPPTLGMLKRLSQALPGNQEAKIDVREMTISAEAVSFKAETDSYESAAKIEDALKASGNFAQARKSDEKKSGDILLFNMSIPLGEPEVDTTAPGAEPVTEKEG
ncbi:MAG: hypothetical protein EXR71_02290 [Myxococcales bacterium]|nr:hypothetical protein [Myxococcales bacterium]